MLFISRNDLIKIGRKMTIETNPCHDGLLCNNMIKGLLSVRVNQGRLMMRMLSKNPKGAAFPDQNQDTRGDNVLLTCNKFSEQAQPAVSHKPSGVFAL